MSSGSDAEIGRKRPRKQAKKSPKNENFYLAAVNLGKLLYGVQCDLMANENEKCLEIANQALNAIENSLIPVFIEKLKSAEKEIRHEIGNDSSSSGSESDKFEKQGGTAAQKHENIMSSARELGILLYDRYSRAVDRKRYTIGERKKFCTNTLKQLRDSQLKHQEATLRRLLNKKRKKASAGQMNPPKMPTH